MQEVTPERKWAGSITGKGGLMVITLTLIYPRVSGQAKSLEREGENGEWDWA